MAEVHAGTYFWIVWFEVAVEHESAARLARIASKDAAIGEAYITSQDDELKAAMVAVSAAAHAIDAFYGTVEQHIDLDPKNPAAWRKNRTPRRSRILETLKAGFDIGSRATKWEEDLRWLFDLRDAAVHHESRIRPTGDHPSGRVMVVQENIDYSREAAMRAVNCAFDVLTTCLRSPKSSQAEICSWIGGDQRRADQLEQIRFPAGPEFAPTLEDTIPRVEPDR